MTSHKIEMVASATFQPYAECGEDGCGWETEQSSTARDRGKSHARVTAHRVRIVVEQVSVWGPKR